MITKVDQVNSVSKYNIIFSKDVRGINKDCEEYDEYQILLKQYMTDITKFNSDL